MKVDQTMKKADRDPTLDLQRRIDFDNEKHYYCPKDEIMPESQTSTICSNAKLAKYYKDYGNLERKQENFYNPKIPASYPENIYDLVIIDEAHSVFNDSSYQDAPFYVYSLINTIVQKLINGENIRCKHLILMTATPEILPDEILTNFNVIDLRGKVYSVYPEKIYFVSHRATIKGLKNLFDKGDKILYFRTSIDDRKSVSHTYQIDVKKVGVTHNNELVKDLLSEEDYDMMDNIDAALADDGRFLNDMQVLFATSKLTEGVDIFDDITDVFVESHVGCDILQSVGRIRQGCKRLYIVRDADQDSVKYQKHLRDRKRAKYTLEGYNKMINDTKNLKERQALIKDVCRENQYILYNYITQRFEYYKALEVGIDYIQSQLEAWKNTKDYADLMKPLFPDSEIVSCSNWDKIEFDQQLEELKEKFFSGDDGFTIGETYSRDAIKELASYILQVFHYKKLNSILKFLGLKMKQAGKHHNSVAFTAISEGTKI